jgi:thiol-disulfide isomerase/thioredoxin
MKFLYFLFVSVALLSSCDDHRSMNESASDQTLPVAKPAMIPDQMAKLNSSLPEIFGKNHLDQQVDIRKIPAKYILLEFWASWCPPCRKFNPGLVKVYDKHHSNGFEILSVSLDDKHSKWAEAIEKDNLHWPYHICEFTGWESKFAAKYEVESIPTNILFDSTGKILARDLDPEGLDKALTNLLVQ